MNTKQKRLECTAIHEAGHAVAAYANGRRMTKLSIEPDEDTLGRVVLAPLRDFEPDIDISLRTRAKAEIEIVVFMAGAAAEELLTARHKWQLACRDLDWAGALAMNMTGSEEETNAYLEWLWERTKGLMRVWQSAVRALANELLKQPEMSVCQAHKIIQGDLEQEAQRLRKRRKQGERVRADQR